MYPAFIAHAVPGRVRIKIPAKRGDGLYFANLETGLQQCVDVISVQTNCHAASVLIAYRADRQLQSIAAYASAQKLFALRTEPAPALKTIAEMFSANLGEADRLLGTLTRGQFDMQSIFFLLFVGLGLRQVLGAGIMPPAIPLLWRVVEIMRELKRA